MEKVNVKTKKELNKALNARSNVIVLSGNIAKVVFLGEKKFGGDSNFKKILYFLMPISIILFLISIRFGAIGGIIGAAILELGCMRFCRAYTLRERYTKLGYKVAYEKASEDEYITYNKSLNLDNISSGKIIYKLVKI